MPDIVESELEMSDNGGHEPQDTLSQIDFAEQIEAVASTSPDLTIRVRAEESGNEKPTLALGTLRHGEVQVAYNNGGPPSQPLIALPLTSSATTFDVSRVSSTIATDPRCASVDQADVGCADTPTCADTPMLANRPTSASGLIRSIDSMVLNAESADPWAIDFNSVSSETTHSSVSGDAMNGIPEDHMIFTPQTPTHTAVQPTEIGEGASTTDEEAPYCTIDEEEPHQDLNGIDEGYPEDLYMVPGDDNYVIPGDGEGEPSRGVYQIGGGMVQIELMALDPRQRIHLPLPNPRNVRTIDVVVTVPYERGRTPVSLTVALPPRNGPFDRDSHHMLQFDVTQESDDSDDEETPGTPNLPLDGGATVENWKAVRFVKQLPRLDLVDMPELQDHPCWICQEPYVLASHPSSERGDEHETPVRLSCNHVFGERCLTSWLHTYRGDSNTFNTQCPLCRQELSIDQAGVMFNLPQGVSREPEGVSPRDYDLASYHQIILRNQLFGLGWLEVLRDSSLAAELMLPDCLSQDSSTKSSRSLFEALQLTGAFRSPHVTEEYRAYGQRSDLDIFDILKTEGAHWTTRWGMLSHHLLTTFLSKQGVELSKLPLTKPLTSIHDEYADLS